MTVAVLGAGPGGYTAAIRAAQLGADVTVIESTEVGGTCLNKGCIPTKTLLSSASAFQSAKKLDSFGVDLKGSLLPNLGKMVERKNKVVSTQVKGIRALFKSWGITLLEGQGAFLSPNEMMVTLQDGNTEHVRADAFIIATGSSPANIPSLPFDGNIIISSTEALDLTEIPERMLIVGAGVIGCEFAFIFRELGAEITIVELLSRAVSTEDEAVSKELEKELRKKKIRLFNGTSVKAVDVSDGRATVTLSNGQDLTVSKILVSIGRTFNTTGIGLEKIGIELGKRKEIIVNDHLQTNLPNIYAVGDVTGGMLLAHVASKQGQIAAENIMGGDKEFSAHVVPAAIFTEPEIASVGLREQQAREDGLDYRTGEFQFRTLGKAHAMGEISGFIKVIADGKNDRILGAHIIGPHASDLIHEFAVAMNNGLTAHDVADTIHAHPTLAEGIMEACEAVHDRAIHVLKK